jgi:hypothetical protein
MLLMGAGLSAAVLSGCAGATAEQKAAAASAQRLSGPEVSQLLVGNSMTGKAKGGEQWTEYYDTSGHIAGLWTDSSGTDKYVGTWRVDGDKKCVDYEGTEHDGCYGLARTNDVVYHYNTDGTTDADRPAALIIGKAPGL